MLKDRQKLREEGIHKEPRVFSEGVLSTDQISLEDYLQDHNDSLYEAKKSDGPRKRFDFLWVFGSGRSSGVFFWLYEFKSSDEQKRLIEEIKTNYKPFVNSFASRDSSQRSLARLVHISSLTSPSPLGCPGHVVLWGP
jgi:hypothetical protein